MMKNRVHALLAANGISIDATDIFGKKGMAGIITAMKGMTYAQRFIIT